VVELSGFQGAVPLEVFPVQRLQKHVNVFRVLFRQPGQPFEQSSTKQPGNAARQQPYGLCHLLVLSGSTGFRAAPFEPAGPAELRHHDVCLPCDAPLCTILPRSMSSLIFGRKTTR
jgi:hypothetical protein